MIISNPNRPLDRATEISKGDYFCQKIAPYVIILFSVLLIALALLILVRYGRLWFATPQNTYEHLTQVVGCIL